MAGGVVMQESAVLPLPRTRWAGAGAAALVATVALGGLALALALLLPSQGAPDTVASRVAAAVQAGAFIVLAVTGAVLLHRRPQHRMGWLLAGAGLAQLAAMCIIGNAALLLSRGTTPPDVLLWATNWVWVPAQVGLLLVLLRFPDGRLPGPGWRVVEAVVVVWGAVAMVTTALLPGPLGSTILEHLDNPYGWSGAGPLLNGLLGPLFLVMPGLMVVAAASLVVRWRRADVQARQQLRWVAAAAALTVVAAPVVLLGTASSGAALALAMMLLASAIAVAELRSRLWELGLMARALLAGAVTVLLLVAAYVAAVQTLEGEAVPVVAGLAVALLAAPVHRLARRLLDRFLLGTNGDPARVARVLRRQLSTGPLDSLDEAASGLAEALRLPWVGFSDLDGVVVARSGGDGGDGRLHVVPIGTGGEPVGRLLVRERATGEGLSPRDLGVLADVATASALVLRAVSADARLAESSRRLGTVRREERARLQRDLHDGLGPTLGGISLRAEAARNLVAAGAEPDRVDAQLDSIGADAEAAVAEIRRLIDELRPTALGEAGLVEAVDLAVATAAESMRRSLRLDLPAELDSATEVAAYRIIVEAVRNAARHAQAASVRVDGRIEDGWVVLRIADDGQGVADAAPGVGIHAMTARATELGGTLSIAAGPGGGTTVVARWPLAREVAP